MGQFDTDRTVVSIKGRMKGLGVDMDRYIGSITNTWSSTPMGFAFSCKDKRAYLDLMDALVRNARFGADSMLGGSQHQGVSFREVSDCGSLHIILSNQADRLGATCSVHLDSVSVVTGKDAKTGQVTYDTGKVLQHVATDLLHTPLIVPSSDKGIVFGFRF